MFVCIGIIESCMWEILEVVSSVGQSQIHKVPTRV